jgi:type I restriction enzyme M protein
LSWSVRFGYSLSTERIARLDEEKVLTRSGTDLKKLKASLTDIPASRVFNNRNDFLKSLGAALRTHRLSLSAPQLKAVWQCLSERTDTADVCLDAEGKPETDSQLRDTENVPLGEDIGAYFKREVKPYVSDAWMARDKDRIGYEISFTRYFYKSVAPRSLQDIDADLKAATREIVSMLTEVSP